MLLRGRGREREGAAVFFVGPRGQRGEETRLEVDFFGAVRREWSRRCSLGRRTAGPEDETFQVFDGARQGLPLVGPGFAKRCSVCASSFEFGEFAFQLEDLLLVGLELGGGVGGVVAHGHLGDALGAAGELEGVGGFVDVAGRARADDADASVAAQRRPQQARQLRVAVRHVRAVARILRTELRHHVRERVQRLVDERALLLPQNALLLRRRH
mmetsp:Transcript_5487/g.17268  ORF Transcript_5487/g.17268 Transcript_5487/m.17268 type:complete len:213 (-) Transcript_5487:995-1633(-)